MLSPTSATHKLSSDAALTHDRIVNLFATLEKEQEGDKQGSDALKAQKLTLDFLLGAYFDNNAGRQSEMKSLLEALNNGLFSHKHLEQMIKADHDRSSFILKMSTCLQHQLEVLFASFGSVIEVTQQQSIASSTSPVNKDALKNMYSNMNLILESVQSLSKIALAPSKNLDSMIERAETGIFPIAQAVVEDALRNSPNTRNYYENGYLIMPPALEQNLNSTRSIVHNNHGSSSGKEVGMMSSADMKSNKFLPRVASRLLDGEREISSTYSNANAASINIYQHPTSSESDSISQANTQANNSSTRGGSRTNSRGDQSTTYSGTEGAVLSDRNLSSVDKVGKLSSQNSNTNSMITRGNINSTGESDGVRERGVGGDRPTTPLTDTLKTDEYASLHMKQKTASSNDNSSINNSSSNARRIDNISETDINLSTGVLLKSTSSKNFSEVEETKHEVRFDIAQSPNKQRNGSSSGGRGGPGSGNSNQDEIASLMKEKQEALAAIEKQNLALNNREKELIRREMAVDEEVKNQTRIRLKSMQDTIDFLVQSTDSKKKSDVNQIKQQLDLMDDTLSVKSTEVQAGVLAPSNSIGGVRTAAAASSSTPAAVAKFSGGHGHSQQAPDMTIHGTSPNKNKSGAAKGVAKNHGYNNNTISVVVTNKNFGVGDFEVVEGAVDFSLNGGGGGGVGGGGSINNFMTLADQDASSQQGSLSGSLWGRSNSALNRPLTNKNILFHEPILAPPPDVSKKVQPDLFAIFAPASKKTISTDTDDFVDYVFQMLVMKGEIEISPQMNNILGNSASEKGGGESNKQNNLALSSSVDPFNAMNTNLTGASIASMSTAAAAAPPPPSTSQTQAQAHTQHSKTQAKNGKSAEDEEAERARNMGVSATAKSANLAASIPPEVLSKYNMKELPIVCDNGILVTRTYKAEPVRDFKELLRTDSNPLLLLYKEFKDYIPDVYRARLLRASNGNDSVKSADLASKLFEEILPNVEKMDIVSNQLLITLTSCENMTRDLVNLCSNKSTDREALNNLLKSLKKKIGEIELLKVWVEAQLAEYRSIFEKAQVLGLDAIPNLMKQSKVCYDVYMRYVSCQGRCVEASNRLKFVNESGLVSCLDYLRNPDNFPNQGGDEYYYNNQPSMKGYYREKDVDLLKAYIDELLEEIDEQKETIAELNQEVFNAMQGADKTPGSLLFFAALHDPFTLQALQQLSLQMNNLKAFAEASEHVEFTTLRKRLQVCMSCISTLDKFIFTFNGMHKRWLQSRLTLFQERSLTGGDADAHNVCPLCFVDKRHRGGGGGHTPQLGDSDDLPATGKLRKKRGLRMELSASTNALLPDIGKGGKQSQTAAIISQLQNQNRQTLTRGKSAGSGKEGEIGKMSR